MRQPHALLGLCRRYGWEVVACLVVLSAGSTVRDRVAENWTFVGSDSFAYMGAATEMAEHHRFGYRAPTWYAHQPEVTPLGYCRLPGYPAFLLAAAHPPVESYEEYYQRAKPVQRWVDLATALVVFLLARFLVGRGVAWLAFLFVTFNPFLILYSASLLTETLATFLTTAAWALICWAAHPRGRRQQAALLAAAGGVIGLSTLVRIDGVLLLVGLLVPWLWRATRTSLRPVLLGLLGFALIYWPWPVRNLLRFGRPHFVGGICNTSGIIMPRVSYMDWFATWMVEEKQGPPTLYCFMRDGCLSTIQNYPAEAFDSPAERAEVSRLFRARATEGLSPRVDEGFRALARARIRSDPWRRFVSLPARRAYHLWLSENDQPLRATFTLPWPEVTAKVRPYFRKINVFTVGFAMVGVLALLCARRRRGLRAWGVLGLTLLVVRTTFLVETAFVEARYVLELMPLALLLAGFGVAQLIPRWRRASASDEEGGSG